MRENTPWEQHASAAGLPRYNYKALSSTRSLKGFLITCALDREKSATKEAMGILTKLFGSPTVPKTCHSDGKNKGELVGQPPGDECGCTNSSIAHSPSNQIAKKQSHKDEMSLKRSRTEFEDSTADTIFLLKMAQKGIISIFWENSEYDDPVTMLMKVLADVENGSVSPLRWCQRMVPVQASCVYSRESFSALVTKLVMEYVGKFPPTETQPLKYAVSFNRRGFEAREVDGFRSSQNEGGLDKMTCIHLVTAAVASVATHTTVDLGAPQMVVIVEVIPLAGVQIFPICGVAVLSGTLMNAKPKLSVKSLTSSRKAISKLSDVQTSLGR